MFTDKTDSLQKLLDAGNGIVTFPDGEHLISRALEISDRTRLVCSPRTHLKLADNANCPIIKNRDKGREMTRHVTIEGGIWDGNNLQQQRDQYKDEITIGHSSYYGDTLYPHLMGFTYVEDFTLRGVTVKDPEAFAVQLTAVNRFTVADVTFDFNMARLNMDGIHVNGFARDGHITNLRGCTNDDMVALNADEGLFACDRCDIENITIDGLYGGNNGWTAVRLLSRIAKLKHITIRNVFGAYRHNAVTFTHWAKVPGDYGWFDGIILDGIYASSARKIGERHSGLIWFQPGVRHVGTVMIDNVMRIDEPDAFNSVHTIDVAENVSIDNLVIGHVRQRVPDAKELVRIGDGAMIRQLDGQNFLRLSGGPLPLEITPATAAKASLFIADDPAQAREVSLEMQVRGAVELPEITLNGHLLKELKSTRNASVLTLTLSSAELQKALKRGPNEFSFTLATGDAFGRLVFAPEWTVFGPCDETDPDPAPAELAICPATLRLGDKDLAARQVKATDRGINLGELFGGHREKLGAWVYITVTAPRAGRYFIGLGADWWLEAFLDGKPLLSTLETGNQHSDWWGKKPDRSNQVAVAELTAGVHTLAVRVLSGSAGWMLDAGPGPVGTTLTALSVRVAP